MDTGYNVSIGTYQVHLRLNVFLGEELGFLILVIDFTFIFF